MHIYVDSASLDDIEEWDAHPWVSGFTTNPTLMGAAGISDPWEWAKRVVQLTEKPISIDGPPGVHDLAPHVWRKVTTYEPTVAIWRQNLTAVCCERQIPDEMEPSDIISVFAGRIMDTGRDPQAVIDAARETGAKVLWASVREPHNVHQAEWAGCDIVTVPPAILRKYLDWANKPLEVVAAETIQQFERDAAGW